MYHLLLVTFTINLLQHCHSFNLSANSLFHENEDLLTNLQRDFPDGGVNSPDFQKIYKKCALLRRWGALRRPKNHLSSKLHPYRSTASSLCQGQVDFFIAVTSEPAAFKHRHLIRHTWGSTRYLLNYRIALGFFIGMGTNSIPDLQQQIVQESLRYGDIIQRNFDDTFRNATLKHLSVYQWLLQYCSSTKYLLKVKDNIFVDIYHVTHFLKQHPPRDLYCKVIRNGGVFYKEFYPTFEWAVTKEEYPATMYPPYCDGFAYLMDASKVRDVYWCSLFTKFFWVDDVYLSGMVGNRLKLIKEHLIYGHSYGELQPTPSESAMLNSLFLSSSNGIVFPDVYQQAWRNVLRHFNL